MLLTVSYSAHELKYTEETPRSHEVEISSRSPAVDQLVCTRVKLAFSLRCEPGNSLSSVLIAKLTHPRRGYNKYTWCIVKLPSSTSGTQVARIHNSDDIGTMSAAQLRRHHQQQAGLNVCWQRYCSLRQGVLEAANATGHPTSNISKLDAQLEAVSRYPSTTPTVQIFFIMVLSAYHTRYNGATGVP